MFFYLPLQENVMNLSGRRHPALQKYILKDNVGILVLYEQPEDLNESVINANDYGIRDTWTIIEAETVADAIKTFRGSLIRYQLGLGQSYEGAKIGGKRIKQKALRIDTGRRIVQLPFCPLMKKEGERFVCREGDFCFGDCVVGGVADFPDGECPMKKFCNVASYGFSKIKNLPKGYIYLKIITDNIVYNFAKPDCRNMIAAISSNGQPPEEATKTS